MLKYRSLASSIFLTFAFVAASSAQSPIDTCRALLPEGAYDRVTQTSFQSAVNTAMERLCQAGATTESQANSLIADIPLGDSGALLGFKGTQNNFSTWLSNSCRTFYSNNKNFSVTSYDSQVVSDNASAIAAACGQLDGVTAYIRKTFPPTDLFALVLDYRDTAGPYKGVALKLGRSNVRCGSDGEPPVKRVQLARGSTQTLTCKLVKPDAQGMITLEQANPPARVFVNSLPYSLARPVKKPERKPYIGTDMAPTGTTADYVAVTGGPGWTKVAVKGQASGKKEGPGNVTIQANVTIAGADKPCLTAAPGSGNVGVPFSCEKFVYTPTGSIAISISCGVDGGGSCTGLQVTKVEAEPQP